MMLDPESMTESKDFRAEPDPQFSTFPPWDAQDRASTENSRLPISLLPPRLMPQFQEQRHRDWGTPAL